MRATNTTDTQPTLSVVVAIIAGGYDAMATCLRALAASAAGHKMECIVPYDERLDQVPTLVAEFPWVSFVDARPELNGQIFGAHSREHHDILRAIGLRDAKGRIVALLEDHGTPSAEWVTAVLEAHETGSSAVGGAVENGVDRLLNWAVYYCDFGRYQNPVPEGQSEFLSDSNISYKREALQSVKHLWFEAFHETSVNWQLRKDGHGMHLDPRMVVYQTRKTLRLFPALRERFVWGRSFAGTRAAEISSVQRALFASLSFTLPFILSWRILSQGLRKGRHTRKLVLTFPLLLILEAIWSAGEFAGYLTGRTGGPEQVNKSALRRRAAQEPQEQ